MLYTWPDTVLSLLKKLLLRELCDKICDQHVRDDDNSYRETEFDREKSMDIECLTNIEGLDIEYILRPDGRELLSFRGHLELFVKKMTNVAL